MKNAIILVLHLLTTVARLLGPGGSRQIIAENLLLKHQLLIYARTRKRAPSLSNQDRTLLGFWSAFLNPRRIARLAILVKPSTLFEITCCTHQEKIPSTLLL